jgi:hypothetical protein
MSTVAGIFQSRADAERAAENLRSAGISDDRINLLTPGTTPEEMEAAVPTTETEQPGMGGALGGTVGAALGAAGGMHIGAALASLLVPGVGPVFAAGVLGAALLGTGGAVAGAAAGSSFEENVEGLPVDELYVYEDALRRGHSVVIAVAEDEERAEAARNVLGQAGAESVDAAREDWWVGLRDAEEAEYTVDGGDFSVDEPVFRKGFEASLHPRARGRAYDEDTERLRECYGAECEESAFRHGYDRGRRYQGELLERHKG